MNILLLGGGGREHALAWKLAQSPMLDTLYAAPGNHGIAEWAELVTLDLADHTGVVNFCRVHAIELVVIGPELPLVDGLANSLRTAGFAVFGPDRAAAQLEGSKSFTKALCAECAIPTARYSTHDDLASARAGVTTLGYPVVIKADGLAAGKGVVIADDERQALAAIDTMFADPREGTRCRVVIEEFLVGEEVSLFALSDGDCVRSFGSAQDHKRIGEGDTGPNTGGMGAYSPAGVLTPALEERAMDEIIRPTIAWLAARGTPFVGVLYAGLMLTADGPKLIEYNVRFGDPEAQVILPRYQGDLVALLYAVATGSLDKQPPIAFHARHVLAVVIAARGYPTAPEMGGRVELPRLPEPDTITFIAGAKTAAGHLVASGGRVLAVTGMGCDLATARDVAYRGVLQVTYLDGIFRRDIGWRELARLDADKA